MADDQYRGILTDREKEIISGENDVSDSYYSRVKTRVRNKIEFLGTDLELLKNYEPELASELQQEVCDE